MTRPSTADQWPAQCASAPVDTRVSLPGSKSQTNRELVLAALAEGPGTVRRALRSRDTDLMGPALTALGLDSEMLAATAARLRLAADAVEVAASVAVARHVAVDALAVVAVASGLFGEPEEVARRVIVRILLAVGGEAYPPRGERLEALVRAMRGHARGRFKRTLAGTVIEEFDTVGRPGKPDAHGTGMAGAIVAQRKLMGIAPGSKILAIVFTSMPEPLSVIANIT